MKKNWFLIFILTTILSCSSIKEVTLHKAANNYSLWVFKRTGKIFLVGHGGFLIRETSMFIIELPNNKGKFTFDKLKVKQDKKELNLVDGSIEFLNKDRLKISLVAKKGEQNYLLEINGTHKIDSK